MMEAIRLGDRKSDGCGPFLLRRHKEERERDEAKRNMDQISASGRPERLFYDLAT
jgi:hypothetical protein